MEYLKALHIIFVVTWFAGLFYIVRLFIYFTEANSKEEPDKTILIKQYGIMMRRLWYGITWPSMILSILFGWWFAFWMYGMVWFKADWLVLKLGFVTLLVLYHLQCGRMYRQLKSGVLKYSSFKLRLWNEVTTLLLIIIVFIVVLKDKFNFWWGVVGLLLLAAILWLIVWAYRKKRQSNKGSDSANSGQSSN